MTKDDGTEPNPEGMAGLSLGFQPQVSINKAVRPHKALRVRRSSFVLVLVLERCCLEQRRVNPIRSAFPGLHPRSGLEMLKGAPDIGFRVLFVAAVPSTGRLVTPSNARWGGGFFSTNLGLTPD